MEIVLVHPEIPQNTGSIARTCAATKTPLCLIEPLGFDISEKAVRRAGLDYWKFVSLSTFSDWESYSAGSEGRRLWFFSRFAERTFSDVSFSKDDVLVFGGETKGLPDGIKETVPKSSMLRIPIWCDGVRSLNLSNAVSIALYEAYRQVGYQS